MADHAQHSNLFALSYYKADYNKELYPDSLFLFTD